MTTNVETITTPVSKAFKTAQLVDGNQALADAIEKIGGITTGDTTSSLPIPIISTSSTETYQGIPITLTIVNYDSTISYYVILPDGTTQAISGNTYEYTPDFNTLGEVSLKFFGSKSGYTNSGIYEIGINVLAASLYDTITNTNFEASEETSSNIIYT